VENCVLRLLQAADYDVNRTECVISTETRESDADLEGSASYISMRWTN
jgi:hypothetical protein